MSLSCTVNEILSLVSQNLRRSRDTLNIPFGGDIWCMHQYSYVSISRRNLKCLASPVPKIRLGQMLKKRVTRPGPRPLGRCPSSTAKHLIYSTCIQNLATVAWVIPEIWLRVSKVKNGHVTLITPLLRVIRPPYDGTWYSLHVYKIWSL